MVSTVMPRIDKHVILLGGLSEKKKLAKADQKKGENRIRPCHVYYRGMNCIMLFWVLLMKMSRKNNLHLPSTV